VNVASVGLLRAPDGAAGAAGQQQGTGSGFVIDAAGHIVTNDHVVSDAGELRITFLDHSTFPAVLVGRDPDNDLAVVWVDPAATTPRGSRARDLLRPVKLGDSDRIVVGEDAIAIGSPLGLQHTVTAGIVSALRDPLEDPLGAESIPLLGGAVQTDAAVNPGNSGGPLFNALGEVIGVNAAGLSPTGASIGLNFAIPVNVVKRVVPELIARGCYRHPSLGARTIPLSLFGPATRKELRLPEAQNGLLVTEATGGAAAAGLRAGERVVSLGTVQVPVGGDILVAVDGIELVTAGELRAYIENRKRPGDAVVLTVLREGVLRSAAVTLGERPSSQPCL
jgi:2-alkenal reductase